MTAERFNMFRNRLIKVDRHVSKQARRLGVSCYRLYDHDLPEFPFCIERYGDDIYVAEYKRRHGMTAEEHDSWVQQSLAVIREVLDLPGENIFLKLRQVKQGRQGQYRKQDSLRRELVVEENGLKFIVNLSDYLDTGLFLDHRDTRKMVQQNSEGRKVLNLFAYTGSFSVYAAAGKAAEVVTVDLSNTYLDWAKRNMELNGFSDEAKYRYVHADVKQYLPQLQAGYFDIIVMDPPTFSNSQRMEEVLDIQRDHAGLINNCLAAMKPGGRLYFSTNARTFQLDKEKINAGSVKDITRSTTPFDFEGRLHRWCYLIEK